ncbi:MAG: Eco57I restriction-modification methylase domain-containing protein [Gemmataceae bacterium]
MKFDPKKVRQCLKTFDFSTLFREHLGWDKHQAALDIPVDGETYHLAAVAQKRGFTAYVCPTIPDRDARRKIDHQVTKSAREHFVIYTDQPAGQQVWQWVRRDPGKPIASRDHRFDVKTTGDALIQRLDQIAVALDEEENITVVDVASRARAAFDVDRVTKRFYDRFKAEHAAFLKFIKGIRGQADLEWYTSLMLNRLMFVYFIQKKGFLDGDTNYLQNRLRKVREIKGRNKFHSFYRYFLIRLFHDGLGKPENERSFDRDLEALLGKVPYLNGGFFEVHQLEQHYTEIDIPDQAFENLFTFFDQYSWHLDERPLRAGNEINPDVVGYIFEKYINQKQMGAYYTKEDITEYISKNTIIPHLFDAAQKKCPIAFKPDAFLWRLLRDDPDRYIYAAVRHGVICSDGSVLPETELPDFVQKGLHDVSARMHDKRFNLEQAPKDDPIRLPTETWREYMYRRQRCLEIRDKLQRGEVHQINDLITLNLDIWQFARDAIVNSEGPELLRAFWHVLIGRIPEKSHEKHELPLSVLDPTCGSGAFLFAALRILETLYSDCLERMQRFIEDLSVGTHHPEKYKDFKTILADIQKHPNERYYILKSIIIHNLYGVDIMEEAVEICKLRLFLKLVAQVESVEQIEPLPDIDFNIRAGNTLVGYTSLEQVRESQKGTLGFGQKEIQLIEDEVEAVEAIFRMFQRMQTRLGGRVTTEDKEELRGRLAKLSEKLNRYLAGEYGIDADRTEKEYLAWKTSHQPFHWLAQFYGIMRNGGFDVIIGNPPYVEYSKVKHLYTVQGLKSVSCGNLYAFVLERSLHMLNQSGYCALIIPLSVATTERMKPIQQHFLPNRFTVWISHYDVYPCKLFEGAKQRLSILISTTKPSAATVYTTRYNRWRGEEREFLFQSLRYGVTNYRKALCSIIKAPDTIMQSLLDKLLCHSPANFMNATSDISFYVHRIPYNYIKAINFVPYFWNETNGTKKSEDYKPYYIFNPADTDLLLAMLNSNLFFWWWYSLFEGYHCGKHEICSFPAGLDNMSVRVKSNLAGLAIKLMDDLQQHKRRRKCQYKNTGKVEYDEFFPRLSKPIIDEIDTVLAQHYGFTDEELDFVINYDIKYRMGQDGDDSNEE